jgi:predicted DCC family thiol-disulfide oxidoreductase YuxK
VRSEDRVTPPDPDHDVVFYDGSCGLCHRFVRFILKRDRKAQFRFAPLESDALRSSFTRQQQEQLPDSVVIVTRDGEVLTRSAGVLYVLNRLGRGWRALGGGLELVPWIVRDAVYDWVASVRYRLFKRPETVCPVVPAELRERFLR